MIEERNVRKTVLSGLFWVYCETMAAQVMTFAVSIILARLLEPGHYGIIAIVNVFINIANVFVTSSFSLSLVQKKNTDDLDCNTMFWFNLVLSVILYFMFFIFAPFIAEYYENTSLIRIIRILSLRIPLSAYNSIQQAIVSNHLAFRKSFYATSIGTFFSAGAGIFAAFFNAGVWALVIQNLSSIVCNTLFLMAVIRWHPKCMFSLVRLKSLLGFGWKLLLTGLLFTGYSELRTLVIGKRFSTKELGYYDKGYTFPKVIASNIDATITKVLFPTLSQSQDKRKRLCEMARRAAKTSAYLMTPVLFGLATISFPLVKLLLTEKWIPCVPYLKIMCLVWWMQPTQSCSIQAIKAIGRSDLYLYVEIISKTIGVILIIFSVKIYDSVYAIAISMFIGQMFAVILYGWISSKYIGYRFRDQLADLMLPAMLGVIMCFGVKLVENISEILWVCILVQIVTGAFFYILLSFLFKVEESQYLLKTGYTLWREKCKD